MNMFENPPPQGLENTNKFRLHLLIIHCPLQCFFRSAEWKACEREHTAIVSSASLRRRGLKQHCHAELKSSVREQQWHPRILGNAIQHLQRSIVRKTVVKGEKKVFCTIPNCFQIPPHFFFSWSKLFPKWSADTDAILTESYFSLWSAKRVAAELNLKHDPLPCQVYFLFITHVICCFSALLLHRRLSLGLWWMENDLIFQIIGLIPLLSFLHATFAEGLMWGSLAMSLSIIQTLCLVTFAKQAYMAAGVSVSVSLTVSKNDMKIH